MNGTGPWPNVDDLPYGFSTVEHQGCTTVMFEGVRYPACDVDVANDGLPDAAGSVVTFTVLCENAAFVLVMAQAWPSRHGHEGCWERMVEILAYPAQQVDDLRDDDLRDDRWLQPVDAHRELVGDAAFQRGVPSTACFDPEDGCRCVCRSCAEFDEEWALGNTLRSGRSIGEQVAEAVARFAVLSTTGWQHQAPVQRYGV